ncbi:hypothetical protein CEP53_015228, partial [Fusarium sp. AF-6]
QKPAGHWLARRWSDPTAASKPCLVLVLVLALAGGSARETWTSVGFWYGRKFPPLPTWLLLLLLLHNLTFLTFHFTFAFCLPRLPLLDGSFFDASSAASTITSTPTTAPNVNTLLLIRIPLPASLLFDSSTTFRKLQSHFVGLVVSSFEAVAPLLGANHLGTRVLRQEGNWAGRNQKKEIDNAPLD